jgi:hypothetical protein
MAAFVALLRDLLPQIEDGDLTLVKQDGILLQIGVRQRHAAQTEKDGDDTL